MTTILFADHDYPDVELERALFREAGVEMVTAQCNSEEQVIAHGKAARAILLQYAPITDRVTSRLTEFGLVTAHELVPRSAQTSLDRHASDRP